MVAPAYTRMQVDERRAQLLELGRTLFAAHPYDELSMAFIAEQAGITKPALYHYFPSKQAYFEATLRFAAAEIAALTEPAPDLSLPAALRASIEAYLGWIEQNPIAYERLIRDAGALPSARKLVDELRARTANRILAGLTVSGAPLDPRLRVAVSSWLWLMDGAILDWLATGDLEQADLCDYLLGALAGCVSAAGHPELLSPRASLSARPNGGEGVE